MMVLNRMGKSKIMLIVIGAVAFLILLGGVAFFMKTKGHKNEKKVDDRPKIELALGEFVVNLADKNEIRYVKADIVLELRGEMEASEGEGEKKAPAPIRDAVIQVLSSKTFAELNEAEGKDKLKEDIIEKVNGNLDKEKVEATEAYFNDFAMQ